jgi:hypothetical protein
MSRSSHQPEWTPSKGRDCLQSTWHHGSCDTCGARAETLHIPVRIEGSSDLNTPFREFRFLGLDHCRYFANKYRDDAQRSEKTAVHHEALPS